MRDLSFDFIINTFPVPVWRQSIQRRSLYQKLERVATVVIGNQREICWFARVASFSKYVRTNAILLVGLIIKNFARRSTRPDNVTASEN